MIGLAAISRMHDKSHIDARSPSIGIIIRLIDSADRRQRTMRIKSIQCGDGLARDHWELYMLLLNLSDPHRDRARYRWAL